MSATIALPQPIAAYFQAKNAHDTAGMLAPFAVNAVVHDVGDGEELRGTSAIADWIERTTNAYRVTLEITDATEQDGETVVTALVSGNFPGSPIPFHYHFTLKDDRIAELTIHT
jgi:hypothetical protein